MSLIEDLTIAIHRSDLRVEVVDEDVGQNFKN